jgi:2-oxoglutarate dehydrogenase E1 component
VHIITNNQVGFTTDIRDARSTRHASDLAKGFDVPIVHVNADDPEACLSAVRLCMAYRAKFGEDALVDLVGYRRHGHNEGDEPAYTQPLMYERIKALPSVRELYARALVGAGVLTQDEADREASEAYQRLVDIQQGFKANRAAPTEPTHKLSGAGVEVETGLAADRLGSGAMIDTALVLKMAEAVLLEVAPEQKPSIEAVAGTAAIIERRYTERFEQYQSE